jgi:hypothetical protein
MQLQIEIPEKDLIEFGKATIQAEIEKALKWLKIKQAFLKVSEGLKEIDKELYRKEIEEIRSISWESYKSEIII